MELARLMGVPWETFSRFRNAYTWNKELRRFLIPLKEASAWGEVLHIDPVLDFVAWLREQYERAKGRKSSRGHNLRVMATAVRTWERNLAPALAHEVTARMAVQAEVVAFTRTLSPSAQEGLVAVYRLGRERRDTLVYVVDYLRAGGMTCKL